MALTDHFHRPLARPHRGLHQQIRSRLDLWRSRRALAKLDHQALEDIGVSCEDAQKEARRFIWDAPASWKNL